MEVAWAVPNACSVTRGMAHKPFRWAALLALALATSCTDTDGRLAGSAPASAQDPELRPADAGQVLEAVRASRAPVVLVNVWATWCAPCREEFPDLMRLERAYRARGLELVLVSADFEDDIAAARRFLARHGVDFMCYLKTGDDMRFIDALNPRWSGALPATLIYDGAGRLRSFREGKATYSWLEQQVLEVLSQPS
jgi:thiol-disulfide isomerase/thioredoxin